MLILLKLGIHPLCHSGSMWSTDVFCCPSLIPPVAINIIIKIIKMKISEVIQPFIMLSLKEHKFSRTSS